MEKIPEKEQGIPKMEKVPEKEKEIPKMEKEKENEIQKWKRKRKMDRKRSLLHLFLQFQRKRKKEIIPTNGRKPGGKIIPTQENPTM